ncbi:inositol monophosphatase family protein [Rhizobium hidalgonense]|uniref:Inositol-1-monophosphatase n=1 Tax=Rhizobium hidalgonense TaxID=1538159 RepID=A0A2A6K581_9HYPH|nr:inositol monophosphatase family protein [Rhizobium hidalgonense]MDR9771813.1 inositol monophosphatase family protein [Rhizobium hidalgonense]MDR9809870.1 inositol monophosphatase family protein [Rhizobium hidalgonense]MDR9818100.1 inositol monophosphatase family protein [Rhizobium hidalgonense]PDT19974.1 inositol monophosphatase [Rhizobium hidalgonense]PON05853.1 inositol monophosphatase [Rhizobium hidalgonense]
MSSAFDSAAIRTRSEVAITVALEVGREAARFRRDSNPGTLAVENKGLQDFVTIADRRAEQAIRNGLISRFPDDTFMGEESGRRSGGAGTWVVDPIDGTTNYIRGFRHWAVSIAFVAGGKVEIGVVYDASEDKVFHAVRGGGAFKDGIPVHAAATADPAHALVILGHSRKTSFDDHLALSKRLHERGMDYRRTGAAAIDLVRVAEGAADLYYERHLNAWDMLAGALIAKEAGAMVAMPDVDRMLAQGGPVVAHAPGLAGEFAFILDIEGLTPAG